MALTSEKSSIGFTGIATLDIFLFVTDTGNHRVQKFDTEGTALLEFGGFGDADGLFNNPWGVTSDGTFVYVTDTGNHRVQVFDLDGNFRYSFGSQGSLEGLFDQPRGIAIKNGWLYVVDTNNHRVQVFTSTGIFVMSIGQQGSGDGQFETPTGCAIDGSFFYVDDRGNSRIVILELKYVDPDFVAPPIEVPRNIKTTYLFRLTSFTSTGTRNVFIPMKNMTARLEQGSVTIDVSVPFTIATEQLLNDTITGYINIFQQYHKDDGSSELKFMFIALLENIEIFSGPKNATIRLTGRIQTTFGYTNTVIIDSIFYKVIQNGKIRYRVSPVAEIRPENFVIIEDSLVVVEKVTLSLSETIETMEFTIK